MNKSESIMEIIRSDEYLARRDGHVRQARSASRFAYALSVSICCLPMVVGLSTCGVKILTMCRMWQWTILEWILFIVLCVVVIAALAWTLWLLIVCRPRLALQFNRWRKRTERFFCPRCKFFLPSTMPCTCPRCSSVNGGDNQHGYFGPCRTCQQMPDAILCPRCRRTIALVRDEPILCIAIPTGRHELHSAESSD